MAQGIRNSKTWLQAGMAGCIVLASACALAGGDSRGGHDDGWGGWGPHPTLPVPGVLVFGAVAISAGVAVALRRRKSRDGNASK